MGNKPLLYLSLVLILILLAGTGLGSYYLGKKSVKCESDTIYLPAEPIHDTIYGDDIIITQEVPADIDTLSLLQYCILNGLYDYLYNITPNSDTSTFIVDTLAIINSFITERHYEVELFNIDTIGSCTVTPVVQYNKLMSISYEFTPIHKVTTIEKKRTIEPFIGFGLTSRGFLGHGGLYFNRHIGVEAGVMRVKLMEDKASTDLFVGLTLKL